MKRVVVIAGPNGAGKSTCAPALLKGVLGVDEFVNADDIARGASFAFETTLASRTFAPWLASLAKRRQYDVQLVFVSLSNADLAVSRVRDRTTRGGHSVPAEVIRRRYERGLENFFQLYRQLANGWYFVDNSRKGKRALIAMGDHGGMEFVFKPRIWDRLKKRYANE